MWGLVVAVASAFGIVFVAELGDKTQLLALGYGARLLQPVFARTAAWRVLDAVIALVMVSLALKLAAEGWRMV